MRAIQRIATAWDVEWLVHICWQELHIAVRRAASFPGLALAPHYHFKGNRLLHIRFTGAGEFVTATFPSLCLPLFLLPKLDFEFGV